MDKKNYEELYENIKEPFDRLASSVEEIACLERDVFNVQKDLNALSFEIKQSVIELQNFVNEARVEQWTGEE